MLPEEYDPLTGINNVCTLLHIPVRFRCLLFGVINVNDRNMSVNINLAVHQALTVLMRKIHIKMVTKNYFF